MSDLQFARSMMRQYVGDDMAGETLMKLSNADVDAAEHWALRAEAIGTKADAILHAGMLLLRSARCASSGESALLVAEAMAKIDRLADGDDFVENMLLKLGPMIPPESLRLAAAMNRRARQ